MKVVFIYFELMQKYILSLKEIFKYEKPKPPAEDPNLNAEKKKEEVIDELQEVRKNFFLQAFEKYLQKTLIKNQEKLHDKLARGVSHSKTIYSPEENIPNNLPENIKKVQRIINQRKNNKKLKGSSKIDRFEQKMKIFKDLNSFIDIRSFLMESNLTNYANSEELVMKLKTHYKDSFQGLFEKTNENNEKNHSYEGFLFGLNKHKSSDDMSDFDSKMKSFKKVIDTSKELASEMQRNSTKNDFNNNEMKDLLYSQLKPKINKKLKELLKESNEEENKDFLFDDKLKNLEEHIGYDRKFNFQTKNTVLPLRFSENQKQHHTMEVDKLNNVIKKIMLRGVIDDNGGLITQSDYLKEYKSQYQKIKKVLHKVTKNIYRKKSDFKTKEQKNNNINSASGSNKNINISHSSNENIKLTPFLTDFMNETPYFDLQSNRENLHFIKKNIKDVERNAFVKSLSSHKTQQTHHVLTPKTKNSNIKNLKFPKIMKELKENSPEYEPYFPNIETYRSEKKDSLDSNRSNKKENRKICKKFDHFIKSIDRIETSNKFITENMLENMGEMSKELKKVNYQKDDLQSLREIEPLFQTSRNLSKNTIKKAMKKISNLKL